MSNPATDKLRRGYRFREARVRRCETCRHVKPLPLGRSQARCGSADARCTLLEIVIDNVGCSVCRGHQDAFRALREGASHD